MSVEEESSMQTEAAVLQVAAKEAATGKRLLLKVYDIIYFVILHICFIMFCVIHICWLIYHLSSSDGKGLPRLPYVPELKFSVKAQVPQG